MSTAIFVEVDTDDGALLRARAGPGTSVQEIRVASNGLSWIGDAVKDAIVVVLGARLRHPIRLAQQARLTNQHVQVLILCDADRFDELAQAIRFSPYLGSGVSLKERSERSEAAEHFKLLLSRARQHRQHERIIEAVQAQLPARESSAASTRLYLDRLLDYAPIGVILIGEDESIEAWNRHASELFELVETSAVGISLYGLFPDQEHKRLRSFVDYCRTTDQRPGPETFERRRAGGELQYVDVTATAVDSVTMVIFQDVTDRLLAEQDARRLSREAAAAAARAEQADTLRKLNRELQQRNRELQDFAYVASHDLQEPLRKIRTFADLLWEDYQRGLDEDARLYIERMRHAADRMSSLITDLLAYSRVTTRPKPFEPTDLRTVVEGVLTDLEVLVEVVEGEVEVGEMATIDADPVQMRQLFQNLIGNALKFHRPDAPPRVRVEAETGHRLEQGGAAVPACRIRVQDNGIGFQEKYLDRIFSPFQRLHGRDEFEGTGMGLAICRRIAERHGGTITAESKPGAGSVFTVMLPVRQAPTKE